MERLRVECCKKAEEPSPVVDERNRAVALGTELGDAQILRKAFRSAGAYGTTVGFAEATEWGTREIVVEVASKLQAVPEGERSHLALRTIEELRDDRIAHTETNRHMFHE